MDAVKFSQFATLFRILRSLTHDLFMENFNYTQIPTPCPFVVITSSNVYGIITVMITAEGMHVTHTGGRTACSMDVEAGGQL